MNNQDRPEKQRAEAMKKWSQLVAQAWADEKLKQRLLDDPATVLKEHGFEVPAGLEIRVVEDTDKIAYLTLPVKPAADATELDEGQLKAVAGGLNFYHALACNEAVKEPVAPSPGTGRSIVSQHMLCAAGYCAE